jgi:branched-chain amino acid transport system substrate-binding protein
VVGTSCSSAGVPAARLLSEAGILTVSPSNTAPSLTHPSTHQPFYARTAHNDAIQGSAVARFAAQELGADTAATVHDGTPYPEQLQAIFAEAFATDHGGTVTAQVGVDVDETDFSASLTAIAADSPDVLFFPLFLPAGAYVVAQARDTAGLESTALITSDSLLAEEFLDVAGADAEGVYLSGPEVASDTAFYNDEFLPAYVSQFGGHPSAPFHAHGFDAARLIFRALEEVAIQNEDGSLLIPRTQLRDAFFATSGYQGLVGTLTCNATGDCNPDAVIVVYQVQSGDFVPVWPDPE